MKAKRLNWAKQWRDKDVDFWRSNKAQFVRRRRGEKFHSDCVVQTLKHPTKTIIWSVMSGKGNGRLYVVKSMMREDQYKDVLQNRLIPQLEEWFPNSEPYIFMQDGAPCHTALSIKAFLAEQNIPLLDWPGNSPDMNSIENVWELMKREVAKDVITNKTQLLERIIHVRNHHPQMQETVQSCIDSMPRRTEALIAAKGGSTKY
ncbi:transposable element Tcb2 transposase [Trichonephila clavipes]|nr:transposable element Tcb2 transposase [Trichonephila clavipes]